jgi:hypothetical protein
MMRDPRKRHYVARASILLVVVVLVTGMMGCSGPGTPYELTVSSTGGGSVTAPGEGTYTYMPGTVVNLVAEADDGYRFVNWTGDVGTVDGVDAASANITMNGDYSISANFALARQAIWDWYDLDAIRGDLDGDYILMNDLDSTTAGYDELAGATANDGRGWQPIGNATHTFTGDLYGQGLEIQDLFIDRPDEMSEMVGLFAAVNDGGIIQSIGVVNASVTGYAFVGSLVGANLGTVGNSYSAGNVTGTGYGLYGSTVGGLLGFNMGVVSNSYSTGSVVGKTAVGGLLGFNMGVVSNSYSSSNVTGDEDMIGGLIGFNGGGTRPGGAVLGTVSDCYSTGSVAGVDDVGGLVGFSDGTVTDSFWDTETSGQAASAGGTGKTTAQMQDMPTFAGAGWDVITVANANARNVAYIWNIVGGETYPFLSWQRMSG